MKIRRRILNCWKKQREWVRGFSHEEEGNRGVAFQNLPQVCTYLKILILKRYASRTWIYNVFYRNELIYHFNRNVAPWTLYDSGFQTSTWIANQFTIANRKWITVGVRSLSEQLGGLQKGLWAPYTFQVAGTTPTPGTLKSLLFMAMTQLLQFQHHNHFLATSLKGKWTASGSPDGFWPLVWDPLIYVIVTPYLLTSVIPQNSWLCL